jgi:hypothetical protein
MNSRVAGEQVVGDGADLGRRHDDADQSDHGQADADQGCRCGEDMDAEVGFERALRFAREARVLRSGPGGLGLPLRSA